MAEVKHSYRVPQCISYSLRGIHYGAPTANSLHLLKYYFDHYPEDAENIVLSIKGAYDVTTHEPNCSPCEPNCSPSAIRASVEEGLRVLDGVKKIDVFECARVDPEVPIEESIKALAELVKEREIGGIGLSEVSAGTVRRAAERQQFIQLLLWK